MINSIKKTKLLALLLAVLMLCVSLTACNNDEASSSGEESRASMVESSTEKSEEVSEASAEEVSEASTEEVSEASAEEVSEESIASEEKSEEVSEEASEEPSTDATEIDFEQLFAIPEGYKGHLAGDYFEKVLDAEKGFSFIVEVVEEGTSVSVNYSVKGKNIIITMKMEFMGIEMSETLLFKDGVAYVLYEEDKTYEAVDMKTMNEAFGDLFIVDNEEAEEEFFRSYEVKEKGVTYVIEEYKSVYTFDGETTETIERLFFKGEDLAFIESEGEKIPVEFVVGLDDSLFEIPADYTAKLPFVASDVLKVPTGCEDLAVAKALEKYASLENFGYSIYGESTVDGAETTVETTFGVKNGKAFISERVTYFGAESSFSYDVTDVSVFENNTEYWLDLENKEYTVFENTTLEEFCLYACLFDGYEYEKTTTKKIDGVTYTVDVFESSILDSDNMTEEEKELYSRIKFYTAKGVLKYVEAEGVRMEITFLEESDLTDDLFEIPEGFVEAADEEDIWGEL